MGEGEKPGSLWLSVLSVCNSLIPSRADQNNVSVRETLGCETSKGYHFIFKLDFHVVSSLQRRLEFPGHCNVHHMSSAIIALQVLKFFYKSMPCGLGCSTFNLQTTSMLIFCLFVFVLAQSLEDWTKWKTLRESTSSRGRSVIGHCMFCASDP